MRVAIAAASSGSAETRPTSRPGSRRTLLASSTSAAPCAGASAVAGRTPVAGTTRSTPSTFAAPTQARVAACSMIVAFCTGHARKAAKP